jgi:hypothetical protein
MKSKVSIRGVSFVKLNTGKRPKKWQDRSRYNGDGSLK